MVFTVWDVGGQEKLRPLWRHYFNNTDALIYVVDCCDRERVGRAASEFKVGVHAAAVDALHAFACAGVNRVVAPSWNRGRRSPPGWCLTPHLLFVQQIVEDPLMRHSAILVFANKQDLKNALSPAETCEALGLPQMKGRKWHVQVTRAGCEAATAGQASSLGRTFSAPAASKPCDGGCFVR